MFNPAQMAKLNQQMAKMMDPRVLQQMGGIVRAPKYDETVTASSTPDINNYSTHFKLL